MNDSEIRDYLVDIAERLESLSNVLSLSDRLACMSRINEPFKIKCMLDSIISDELLAMSSVIIDDINE